MRSNMNNHEGEAGAGWGKATVLLLPGISSSSEQAGRGWWGIRFGVGKAMRDYKWTRVERWTRNLRWCLPTYDVQQIVWKHENLETSHLQKKEKKRKEESISRYFNVYFIK